jgi:hypothetical protein
MPLVDVAGFEERLGRHLSGAEATRAAAVLGDVEAIALGEGDPEWTGDTVPAAVVALIYRVARRTFENPTGATQMSVGDVSVSHGRVELSAYELKTIRKAAGTSGFVSATLVSPWNVEVGDA